MTIEFIGTSAGSVWTALNEADALGIKQLKKITKLKEKEIYAALGWLAREGKVNINVDPEDAKELIVSLTQER
ncbi:MAG: winged helix-turn-helix domain-containing protein [Muribaculaceae bacterium]|nr:winged helix-turn-helix domain-containing protein [Muribaculaceae bacterium]